MGNTLKKEMEKKLGILRGINVGGKRRLLMADLKSLCTSLGWEHVETYIQSGNVIFKSNLNNSALEKILEKAIEERFGYEVPVIVRTEEELVQALQNHPFSARETEVDKLLVTFLKEKPSDTCLEHIRSFKVEPDAFEVVDKEVFLYCEGKYHQSKLTNAFFEKKLKTIATTRNMKTVLKLCELLKSME